MSEWIDVKDRLPERSSPIVDARGERPAQFSDSVLLYPDQFDQIQIGTYWFDGSNWEMDDEDNTKVTPTHWMPLPPAPRSTGETKEG